MKKLIIIAIVSVGCTRTLAPVVQKNTGVTIDPLPLGIIKNEVKFGPTSRIIVDNTNNICDCPKSTLYLDSTTSTHLLLKIDTTCPDDIDCIDTIKNSIMIGRVQTMLTTGKYNLSIPWLSYNIYSLTKRKKK